MVKYENVDVRVLTRPNDPAEIKWIAMQQGSNIPPHGHGVSKGHSYVVAGVFEVKVYDPERKQPPSIALYKEGDCFDEPLGTIHSVKCISGPGVFVNVTTPPLGDTMVFYKESELLE